jgi:putative hydrolase
MTSDPFGEIPLFRELQKLLASSGGPVNLEIAKQIARAAAGEGGTTLPDRAWRSGFGDSVRTAELVLGGYTRLSSTEPARVEVLTRDAWAGGTLDAWGWLLEKLAERFRTTLEGPAGGLEGAPEAGPMLGQIVPLLMGLQAGTVIGALAKEAVGRYDLPLPREDAGKLFVVGQNADALIADYGFQPEAFRMWLALREVGRHLVFTSASWVERYLRSAVSDIIRTVEIDLHDLERRMREIQTGGPDALEGLGGAGALPVVPTEQHAQALTRLQAFTAVAEGYAAHAAAAVSEQLIPGAPQIDEGMTRHTASPSEGTAALTSMLGISIDRSDQAAGITFCKAVVQLKGIDALNQLWMAPDNLPTLAEVKDPFAWMERVLED